MFEAAKLANCHEFIMEMKDGYNTMIGEKGIQLSGRTMPTSLKHGHFQEDNDKELPFVEHWS